MITAALLRQQYGCQMLGSTGQPLGSEENKPRYGHVRMDIEPREGFGKSKQG